MSIKLQNEVKQLTERVEGLERVINRAGLNPMRTVAGASDPDPKPAKTPKAKKAAKKEGEESK